MGDVERFLLFPVVLLWTVVVTVMTVIVVVVVAYRRSPTRKYLLAWLSSEEPGLSACGILYRTRGFRIRVA